jgi:ribonuclease III
MSKSDISLGYEFNNPALLDEALTHPSVSYKNAKNTTVNYERLEFLGDSVLGLVIAELLIHAYPEENEGALAKRQAALVRGEALAKIATTMDIGRYIKMADGEEAMGGRQNPRNIENALEAIIGAIYQDGGLEMAKEFIIRWWGALVSNMTEPPKDAKTVLQEWAQGEGYPIPTYEVIQTDGPPHAPVFTVRLQLPGSHPEEAKGESKKKAEKEVAKQMLQQLGIENYEA